MRRDDFLTGPESMPQDHARSALPPIPAKRYFTIGEVSELCGVKPHVLRYWEQEFTQLKPVKRQGNRRYYQHHEVLLIRRIRELLYEEGFTISGARNRLESGARAPRGERVAVDEPQSVDATPSQVVTIEPMVMGMSREELLGELKEIRDLLRGT